MAQMWPVIGAAALAAPWLFIVALGGHPAPTVVALLTGAAILGAAFLLSWAAEVFQMDVSQALALALLALIAVLPEYAVDAVFAFDAGRDPVLAQEGYAVANMTGANRLLIGLGWSSIVLLAWFRHGARRVELERSQRWRCRCCSRPQRTPSSSRSRAISDSWTRQFWSRCLVCTRG